MGLEERVCVGCFSPRVYVIGSDHCLAFVLLSSCYLSWLLSLPHLAHHHISLYYFSFHMHFLDLYLHITIVISLYTLSSMLSLSVADSGTFL